MRIKSLLSYFSKFNENIKKFNLSYPRCYIDLLISSIFFGASPNDYFRYEFYKKSYYEKNKFITYKRSQAIIKKFNNLNFTDVLEDKTKFNKHFKDLIGRDWLDLRDSTLDEFIAFLKLHDEVLMKPIGGGQGIGIFKLSFAEFDIYDFSKYRNFIAEEILVQNSIVSELNSSSVNTVRILTFKGKAIAGAIRIGRKDALVDNLHSKGICGHLDVNFGIIDTLCIDNEYNKYLHHPDNGKLLVGFEIPQWNKIISTVENASRLVPEVKYIGWDVAVLEDNVVLIEGNHDPGHDVVQMINQNGLFPCIKKLY